jgi:hypothetical protein
MSTKCVVTVDLADVWAAQGRKKFLRTLAWGDEVDVVATTSTRIEIETVYFDEQADGSILPVKETGFIEPKKYPSELTAVSRHVLQGPAGEILPQLGELVRARGR